MGTRQNPAGGQRSVLQRLFAPVDIASLAYFRIAFGAIMLWEVCRYFQAGWIGHYYIEPTFHFHYFGFEWVNPWPGAGMYVHFVALGVLAAAVMIGLFYRVCATLLAVGFTYVFLLEKANYLNHFYLICLICFIMACLPAHRAFSIDAWRRPDLRSQTAPAWTLWLLRFQIAVPYFFGGIAKLNTDWLVEGEPLRTWLFDGAPNRAVGPLNSEFVVYLLSWGGMLFDLLIVPMLMWRRSRGFALLLAVGFNVTNAHLFSIGIFPWFMIAATLMFFPPHWPRSVVRVLVGRGKSSPVGDAADDSAAHPPFPMSPRQRLHRRAIVAALAVHFAIQVGMPFRHLLYPDSVHWTEEGHCFSWHMKLRDKSGQVRFIACSPEDGRTWVISIQDELSTRQIRKMAARPDMIHEYARHLGRRFESQGLGQVRIHVQSLVALNGRAPQPLIDPAVDLARQPVTLASKPWIIPLHPEAFEAVRSADADRD